MDNEVEDRFKTIEEEVRKLKAARPGTVSGGDSEFFGQRDQLDEVERRLEVLIELLEPHLPGISQKFAAKYRETTTDTVLLQDIPVDEDLVDDVLENAGEGLKVRRQN